MWALNDHKEVTYNYMFGDKDTFRLAFALANKLDDFYQIPSAPAGAYTTLEVSSELKRLQAEAAAAGIPLGDIFDYSDRCRTSSPGFLLAMMQVAPNGEPLFFHRTNGEFSVRNEEQIRTEFIVAPRSPKQAKELLWQMPVSQGWAVCTDMTPLLTTPAAVELVEESASNTLDTLRNQLSLGNIKGYTDLKRGKSSEIVRAVQLAETMALARRTGNSTPTSAPVPTSAPATPAPTASFAVVTQAITFTFAASEYSGSRKTLCETAYLVLMGCWDSSNNGRYSYCYISSSAARRSAVVTFELRIDQTTSAAQTLANAAESTGNAITTTTFASAVETAKSNLAAAGDTTDYSAVTVSASSIGTVTVTTETNTAPPTAAPVPTATPTVGSASGASSTATISLVTLLSFAVALLR